MSTADPLYGLQPLIGCHFISGTRLTSLRPGGPVPLAYRSVQRSTRARMVQPADRKSASQRRYLPSLTGGEHGFVLAAASSGWDHKDRTRA